MQDTIKYVLVVDDDPTMQLILQGMVEQAGYKAAIAENGEKALQFLDVGQGNISVVLLDYNLPDMNGMEVVKAIKAHDVLQGVPVIMQSGSTDLKQIRAVIEGGVFSYLSKPFPIEALQCLLKMALRRASLVNVLNERVKQGYAPDNLIRSAAFVMRNNDDAKSLSILLSTLFPDPGKIFPGLMAIMTNSIEHGVFEVGYDKKAELINKGNLYEELLRFEKMKKHQKKEVEVQFIHKEGRISVRITDPGKGFEWKNFVNFNVERKSFVNGYGVLKALESFDEVKYNTAGNQVMLSVFEK